jgi:uncharacterized protein YbcI
VAASKTVPPSALSPARSPEGLPAELGLPGELSNSFALLWTHYAGNEPTRAHTEVRGNVVTCMLVDAVGDYNRSMIARQDRATPSEQRKLTSASYKREAIAAVARLTHQRVISFVSSHDRDTDVATEVFNLEPSLGRGARPQRA